MAEVEQSADGDTRDAVLRWFAYGEVGLSSKTMALVACGAGLPEHWCYPLDPADLRRCMLLVDEIPGIRAAFPRIATISPEWAKIIEHWDDLVANLRAEMAVPEASSAPRTYAKMRTLFAEAGRAHR
jgi:hypothetical protein